MHVSRCYVRHQGPPGARAYPRAVLSNIEELHSLESSATTVLEHGCGVEPERRGAQVEGVVLIHTFNVDVVTLARLVDEEHMLEARRAYGNAQA